MYTFRIVKHLDLKATHRRDVTARANDRSEDRGPEHRARRAPSQQQPEFDSSLFNQLLIDSSQDPSQY